MKILVAIASYGTGNDQYLSELVREYRSMPFDVDIVVLSNMPKKVASGVEVVVVDLHGKNPWPLPFPHKQIFASRLNDYDLFIYSEDDTLVTEKNIRAFLEASSVLPDDEVPGFFRFERALDGGVNYPEVHGRFHWDPQSVRLRGKYTLAYFTNEHAACYALTRKQLQRAIDSGGYLVGPHQGKYDLLCSAATDPYTQCGLRKLVCISHLDDFLIHHLPNKYVGTHFGVSHAELHRQVSALLRIASTGHRPETLFQTETKLRDGAYSKNYYEPVQPEVLSAIPSGTRTVLSIGCGWGAIERHLAENGLRVTAVPLDPLIPGGAEDKGVEIVTGNFEGIRRELAGRKFDCLLLSNLLHLVPNPAELLCCFGALMAPGGVAVAVVPNTAPLRATRKTVRQDGRVRAPRAYNETGVHTATPNTVRRWFRHAGMQVENLKSLLRPRAQRIDRFTLGVFDGKLAHEFLVTATKLSQVSAR